MTLRDHQSTRERYIRFANGFPRKEMVPTEEPSVRANMRGGFFVGLHDGATSCMTKSHNTIPPLARRRVNPQKLKSRASSSRFKNKNDPFASHKGTEKLGFTPQSIKHSKPKAERTVPKTEPTSSTATFVNKLGTKLHRSTDHLLSTPSESDVWFKPAENMNNMILSDVENPRTLDELIGIDEVYQRVCNGNMNSLSSLISPVKNTKKKVKQVYSGSSTQYIQTSSPVYLKNRKTPQIASSYYGSNSADCTGSGSRTRKFDRKQQSILVPIPYFANPKPPNTAPARLHVRETYNYPRIYTSRQEKQRPGAMSSLSGWSSPSIINFNPTVDLPEVRPVSRVCAPTGSIIGIQNTSHTGKVAIVASLDATLTPPATAESEALKQGLEDNKSSEKLNQKVKTPDLDSLCSEEEPDTSTQMNKNDEQITQQMETVNNIADDDHGKDLSKDSLSEDVIAVDSLTTVFSFQLNVTDESGQVNEVEIYDPDSRDLEKEEKVNKDIEEAQQNYQKKKNELESLLDEHENLVQEVNHLSKELH